MTSEEIRKKFLDFQKTKYHAIIPSASIIPINDPSLLFVNSGMFPLVPFLLGETHPEGKRLANSQKCFRAEDIDEIGDGRHNTFFEMLGNWSLGDYFKKEQLFSWYEFLIEELKLNPNKLYQTVYLGDEDLGIPKDEESINILKDIFKKYGLSSDVGADTAGPGHIGPGVFTDFSRVRIMAYRDKNWWKRGDAIGEPGGPDSETFYDTGVPHNDKFGKYCHFNCDCGRFIEIGNSVFMEYKKTEKGWEKMSVKNVDFGGGLERITMAANNKSNVFETDLFLPIIKQLENISGRKYFEDSRAFEIIADHIKAAVFIMSDDAAICPSNTGQGYVVRRLIRRAIRYGKQIGIISTDWMGKIVFTIQEIYARIYPEIIKNGNFVFTEIKKEEEKFIKTLENGIKEFNRLSQNKTLSGKEAFNLHQSYGLSKEDIKELSLQRKIEFNDNSFDEELNRHRDISRSASEGIFKGGLSDSSKETVKLHTAAHLLLAALRKILGDHIFQKGSNITAERLRFDFSHPSKINEKEIEQIESLVNNWIKKNIPVLAEEMDVKKAKECGAMGVFDDRYSEKVKVYKIGTQEEISKEICGGPHVSSIGELGKFKIIKEESVSAGVRRIKAILSE